uniref:(northern house mosquito) hypothetical protein n=1 Tax=Culex pipiens TaxID=7175 RepID=A0A8D8J8U3_CULPI
MVQTFKIQILMHQHTYFVGPTRKIARRLSWNNNSCKMASFDVRRGPEQSFVQIKNPKEKSLCKNVENYSVQKNSFWSILNIFFFLHYLFLIWFQRQDCFLKCFFRRNLPLSSMQQTTTSTTTSFAWGERGWL